MNAIWSALGYNVSEAEELVLSAANVSVGNESVINQTAMQLPNVTVVEVVNSTVNQTLQTAAPSVMPNITANASAAVLANETVNQTAMQLPNVTVVEVVNSTVNQILETAAPSVTPNVTANVSLCVNETVNQTVAQSSAGIVEQVTAHAARFIDHTAADFVTGALSLAAHPISDAIDANTGLGSVSSSFAAPVAVATGLVAVGEAYNTYKTRGKKAVAHGIAAATSLGVCVKAIDLAAPHLTNPVVSTLISVPVIGLFGKWTVSNAVQAYEQYRHWEYGQALKHSLLAVGALALVAREVAHPVMRAYSII